MDGFLGAVAGSLGLDGNCDEQATAACLTTCCTRWQRRRLHYG
jgi:hypothetical protein